MNLTSVVQNISTENILSLRSTEIVVFESILIIAIDLVGFIGNFLISLAIFRNTKFHTVTNIYILSLAMSDALTAALVMPLSCGVIITGEWIYGEVMCGIHGFATLALSWVALQTIALSAMNRYFRIVKPTTYRKLFTVNLSVTMVLVSWFVVLILVALPPLCGWASFAFKPERAICYISFPMQHRTPNTIFTAIHLVLFVIIPFFTVFSCYFRVYQVVKRNNTSAIFYQQPRNTSLNMNVEEIRISKTILSITIGYLAIWVPVLTIETLHTLHGPNLFPPEIYLVYSYLWFASSVINPLLYGYMNRAFRKEARRVFPVSRQTKVALQCHSSTNLIHLLELKSLPLPRSERLITTIDCTKLQRSSIRR